MQEFNLILLHHLTYFQVELGLAVQRACESQAEPLKFLYPLESSIKEKIESIAKFYGASGVEYSEQVSSCNHAVCVGLFGPHTLC